MVSFKVVLSLWLTWQLPLAGRWQKELTTRSTWVFFVNFCTFGLSCTPLWHWLPKSFLESRSTLCKKKDYFIPVSVLIVNRISDSIVGVSTRTLERMSGWIIQLLGRGMGVSQELSWSTETIRPSWYADTGMEILNAEMVTKCLGIVTVNVNDESAVPSSVVSFFILTRWTFSFPPVRINQNFLQVCIIWICSCKTTDCNEHLTTSAILSNPTGTK